MKVLSLSFCLPCNLQRHRSSSSNSSCYRRGILVPGSGRLFTNNSENSPVWVHWTVLNFFNLPFELTTISVTVVGLLLPSASRRSTYKYVCSLVSLRSGQWSFCGRILFLSLHKLIRIELTSNAGRRIIYKISIYGKRNLVGMFQSCSPPSQVWTSGWIRFIGIPIVM